MATVPAVGTPSAWCPALTPSTALRHDPVREADLLLMPERVVVLKGMAARILRACDGSTPVERIVSDLSTAFPGAPVARDVTAFLRRTRDMGWVR